MAHKMNPGFKPSPNGSGIFGLPHHIEYGDILVIHIYIIHVVIHIYIYTSLPNHFSNVCIYIYIYIYRYIWYKIYMVNMVHTLIFLHFLYGYDIWIPMDHTYHGLSLDLGRP